MIRHIIIAALRNMAANRLLSAITILGLVLGIVAVLVTASLVRGLYQQNEFIPGYERTFVVAMPQLSRKPARLVTVALANKAARVVWAIMVRGGAYRRPAGVTTPA